MPIELQVVTALFLAVHIVNPLLVYFTQRMRANPNLVAIDPSNVPDEVAVFFSAILPQLQEEGFIPVLALGMPKPAHNLENFLVLLINHSEGDKALLTVISGKVLDAPPITTMYLEFSTRYTTGELFDTMNSEVIGTFKHLASYTRTQVPSVQDPHLLYQIHRFVMNTGKDGRSKQESQLKVLPSDDDALDYLARAYLESFDHQVGFGRMSFNTKTNLYRPTLFGAFCMTLPLLWPWKFFVRAQMKAREQTVLRAFNTQ